MLERPDDALMVTAGPGPGGTVLGWVWPNGDHWRVEVAANAYVPLMVFDTQQVAEQAVQAAGGHAMRYRAGTVGLPGVADDGPRWECVCGRWRFNAKPMPKRDTGNNQFEAKLAHTGHVDAVLDATVAGAAGVVAD